MRRTKTQKRAHAAKRAKQSRLAKAVKGLLKQTNPTAKITGARVARLKGGGLTIRPIKANPGGLKRVLSEYGHQRRGGTPRFAAIKRAVRSTRRNPRRKR